MSQEKLPAVPLYKNTLENREKMMLMGQHRRKLYEICKKKSSSGQTGNNTISYQYLHEENPKKHALLEAKYTEIERENRALFQKIKQCQKKKKSPGHDTYYHAKSLNTIYRKKKVEEIERENVKLFGRIQRAKPSISFHQQDKNFLETRRLSNRLSNIEKNRVHDWYHGK